MVMAADDTAMASTGIPGLDDILGGGLARRRLFLVEGIPGSGKTTFALQCLMEGVRRGEGVMYVTLSETADELRAIGDSHAWSLDGVEIRELTPSEDALTPDDQNTIFHPSEVELTATLQPILADVERLKPMRVVFDSLSEVRLLAASALRYRRQILALKQFFSTRQCTVVLLDDLTSTDHDPQMQSLAHGVIDLELLSPEYGADRRRLRVVKYRGVQVRGGYHDFVITKGGLMVYPRLVAAEHRQATTRGRTAVAASTCVSGVRVIALWCRCATRASVFLPNSSRRCLRCSPRWIDRAGVRRAVWGLASRWCAASWPCTAAGWRPGVRAPALAASSSSISR